MDTATNIQRNIVREIMRESVPRKLKLNENFVAFVVKLLLLDPNWGITDNFMNKRENIQNFVKYVLNELAVVRDAKLTTLKMQFSFVCNLEHAYMDVDKFREKLLRRLSPLMLDICKSNVVYDRGDSLLLYKKITYYATLLSGLGSPILEPVYIEALTALKSIMDENDIREFAMKERTVKEQELLYLTKIITGIRLFNKDCDKGGIGIPNLHNLLLSAVAVLKEETEDILQGVLDVIDTMTLFLDGCYLVKPDIFENSFKLELALPPDLSEDSIGQAKDLLILYRQYEMFIKRILLEIDNVDVKCRLIYEEFEKLLRDIHVAAQYKIAVSVKKIFPMFEALSDHWTKLQNQVIILGVYYKILSFMADYSKSVYGSKAMWEVYIERKSITEERAGTYSLFHKIVSNLNKSVHFYRPETINIDTVKLQYLGFCPWVLVKTEGALVPGNPSTFVAQYKDLFYIFSCPEAAIEFAKNPDDLINHILDLARKKPQLIYYFDMRDQLLQVIGCQQLVKEQIIETKTEDKSLQCSPRYDELEPPFKGKYYWNIWDLKREALQLANLSKCLTVSTQTDKTYSKNTRGSQTYSQKLNDSQTRKDNYTNVPTPQTFFYGLRGRKDKKQFIWDLTAPVEK